MSNGRISNINSSINNSHNKSDKYTDYLDIISCISKEISSPTNQAQLLQNVLDRVCKGMNLQSGTIHLLDEFGDRLILKAQYNISDVICRISADRQVGEDRTAARVISSGLLRIEPYNETGDLHKSLLKSGEHSSAAYVPIKSGDMVVGLMILQGKDFKEFTGSGMALLNAIGRIIGEAVKHIRIDEEKTLRVKELNLHSEINNALNSSICLDKVLKIITDGMVEIFGCTGSLIFLDEEGKGQTLTLNALAFENNRVGKTGEPFDFPLNENHFKLKQNKNFHRLYFEKLPVTSNNGSDLLAGLFGQNIFKNSISVIADLLKVSSMLLIPLASENMVKGLLVLISRKKTSKRDIERIQAFAGQAAHAIEKEHIYRNELRQRQVNETLREVSNVISSTLELKEVLFRILEQLKKVINYQAAGVLLVDEERKKLYVKIVQGFRKDAEKLSLPLDGEKGITVHVARTGKIQYIPDISKDKRHVNAGIIRGSELAVPLKVKDKVIGVLNLESKQIDAFSRDDCQLLSAFANQAAIAIENARLFEAEQSRRRIAETLGEVSRIVNSTLDLNSLLKLILNQAKRILTYDSASILLSSGGKPFSAVSTLGYKNEELMCSEMYLRLKNSPILKKIIKTRQLIIIPDTNDKEGWIKIAGAEHVRSWMGIPLLVRDEVIGVLQVDSSQPGFFTEKDAEVAQALANQTAAAIDNARLFKNLHEEKARLELLYDISHQSASDRGLDQILNHIITRITAELGGFIGHLFTLEQDEQHLKLRAMAGTKVSAAEIDKKIKLHLGEGVAGWVVLNCEPVVIDDVTKDRRWLYVDEIDRKVRSVISVPLLLGKKKLGALSILHYKTGYFDDPAFLHLLTTISHQVAVTIENAILYERIRKSEERFRDVTANTGDWVWEIDVKGCYTYSSHVAAKILGFTPQEILGKHFYDFFNPDESGKLKTDALEIFRSQKPFTSFINRNLHKEGHTVILESSGTPIIGPAGKFSGYRGVHHDITIRKQLEEQLRQAHKIEAIGTLAGGIAHNYNNLLMVIQGNVSLMLLDSDSSHPDYKRLKNIEKQVKSGAELTRQLLGYARKGRYEVKLIRLNRLVEETSDTFGMTRKEITVHKRLAKDLFGIKADRGQIEQILLNLYVNAADAMPGGGDLFLKTTNVTDIDMDGRPYKAKPGKYVLLTVTDTGVGMNKNTMERIFDPFFTTKSPGHGTGLGLSSVYGIIKAHGGYIDVYSEKAHGTTFNIYLPASDMKITEIKEIIEEKNPAGKILKGKETVLLVDDEDMIIDVGKKLLKALGYKVLTAKSGKEAVEIISKMYRPESMEKEGKEHQQPGNVYSVPQLVILDMTMPDMGGGETYDRMKEINPYIRVLLSSGYSINGQAAEILERGCDAFIQKPFDMKQLSQKIREILDKR
ncbi:MAG: GAF domain-containing protein [Spirochaetes bacterium]|nr:GAF domain-containing protein [Spirochaetota bacterium]